MAVIYDQLRITRIMAVAANAARRPATSSRLPPTHRVAPQPAAVAEPDDGVREWCVGSSKALLALGRSMLVMTDAGSLLLRTYEMNCASFARYGKDGQACVSYRPLGEARATVTSRCSTGCEVDSVLAQR